MEASENLTLQDIELSELELEEYEPNELVLETVHDLKLFFNNSSTVVVEKKNKHLNITIFIIITTIIFTTFCYSAFIFITFISNIISIGVFHYYFFLKSFYK